MAYVDGWIGEGQMSYGGPGALERARLALEIVRERLAMTGVAATELRFDLIGVDALYGDATPAVRGEPAEVRVRVAGRGERRGSGAHRQRSRDALYERAGRRRRRVQVDAREVIAVQSVLLPRAAVTPSFSFVEA